ncbi:hypothetical protein T10_6036 [Trichinella papuae]|uniref:Uncharacterized protein n=1 Tax=Trichinella papuae TaxID=268474 RepID=A0A0V1M114_9BILA|nr:hypothetical protein T10_6036 [Trichinella papuae]
MISSFAEPSKKFFFENAFQNLARERNSHKITHVMTLASQVAEYMFVL